VNFVNVKITDICLTGGTQSRAEIDRDVVQEYAEDIERGSTFPPIVIFYDGGTYWLADGFHRYEAVAATGRDEILADVRQGTQRDAILHSVGANSAHGLRRNSGDKRRAVLTLLQDDEWGKWSDREIARRCGVSRMTVARVKEGIVTVTSDSERAYVTKHGTPAIMNVAAINRDRGKADADELPVHRAAPVVADMGHRDPGLEPGRIEASPQPSPAPEGDEARERRRLSTLTREALEDELMELRAAVEKLKQELRATKGKLEAAELALAEATQSDLGRVVGNLQRERDTLSGRLHEMMRELKRMERRTRALEAERDQARADRENELILMDGT
jgi:hypothetical protein